MPSRDVRRSSHYRKKNENGTETEKSSTRKRPILYFFSIVVLVLILITFVAAPLFRNIGHSGIPAFGSYDGKEIKFVPGNYLSRQRDMIANQLQNDNQQTSIESQMYQVWRGAFERTVIHTAILAKMERSGAAITEKMVDQALAEYGPYLNENGEFDEDKYEATSQSERYATRQLYRENLVHDAFIQDSIYSRIQNQREAEFLGKFSFPQRRFRFIRFTYDAYPKEEVITYAESNRALFRRLKLSRITVTSSKKEAQEIYSQIADNPERFEELARNQSQDSFAEKGGDMGYRYYFNLEQDFTNREELDGLFERASGEISGVYEAPFGWTIYRIDETATVPNFDDEGTVQEVRGYLERYERGILEDWMVTRAKDFREQAAASDFSRSAVNFNFDIYETEFFPINFQNAFFLTPVKSKGDENLISGAESQEDFFLELFHLKEMGLSSPQLIGDGVAVFQMLEEKESDQKKVEQIASYYSYIFSNYLEQDFRQAVFTSDKLKDNFNQVFSQLISN